MKRIIEYNIIHICVWITLSVCVWFCIKARNQLILPPIWNYFAFLLNWHIRQARSLGIKVHLHYKYKVRLWCCTYDQSHKIKWLPCTRYGNEIHFGKRKLLDRSAAGRKLLSSWFYSDTSPRYSRQRQFRSGSLRRYESPRRTNEL